jgi:protein arginine kinase activator
MICESCQKNDATVHVTEVSEIVEPEGPEQTVAEQHLCPVCAQALKLPRESVGDASSMAADIWKILKVSAQQVRKRPSVECPDCHMTLDEFRRRGRLGCPKDYEIFKEFLGEQLERMHGAREHRGRIPGIDENEMVRMQRITDLKGELEHAIREEAYEEAATLRDQLKNFEEEHEAPSEPL